MSCTDKPEENLNKAIAGIKEAAAKGAQIVCLQEIFAGLYFCQSEDHRMFAQAEPIPGPTSEALSAAARQHGVVVIGSLFERRAPGGGMLTAEEFLYDGAGAWSTPPVKGDLTKHRRWLDTPSQYVARTTGFDSWGNQTSIADETNRASHNGPRIGLVNVGQVDDPMEDVLEHTLLFGDGYRWG